MNRFIQGHECGDHPQIRADANIVAETHPLGLSLCTLKEAMLVPTSVVRITGLTA